MTPKRFYKTMNPTLARMMREDYFRKPYGRRRFTQAQLARIYRVPQSCVSKTISGITWSHA